MLRVFAFLAVGQFVAFTITAVVAVVDGHESPDRHVTLGVFSLLLSCFTQVIIFTYLTVTEKIITQAVHLGHLEFTPLADMKRMKRTVTRLLAVAVASIVGVTISGALKWRSVEPSMIHLIAVGVVVTVHCVVFYCEYGLIVRSGAVLERTMRTYTDQKKALVSPTSARSSGDTRSPERP